MMVTLNISRAGFKEWLEYCGPMSVVGYARRSCYCPLATYRQVLTGQYRAVMPQDASPWMLSFIIAVDLNSYGYYRDRSLDVFVCHPLTLSFLFRIIIGIA